MVPFSRSLLNRFLLYRGAACASTLPLLLRFFTPYLSVIRICVHCQHVIVEIIYFDWQCSLALSFTARENRSRLVSPLSNPSLPRSHPPPPPPNLIYPLYPFCNMPATFLTYNGSTTPCRQQTLYHWMLALICHIVPEKKLMFVFA